MASVAERVRRNVCPARLPGRPGIKLRPGTRRRGAWLAAGRAFARSSRGNAAIEFGLLAPIFLLILVPVIELGLVLRTRFLLSTQVTSAANYSLVHGGAVADAAEAEAFADLIVAQLQAGRGVETAAASFRTPDGTSEGRYIEITASTSHSSFLGELVSDSNTISVHTLVRVD